MGRQRVQRVWRPVVLYLVLAFAWMLLSDLLLHRVLPPGASRLLGASILKATLFVLVTGPLLFRAISVELRTLEKTSDQVRVLNDGLRLLTSVQRLFGRNDDPRRLVDDVCRLLVDGRQMVAGWIAALDESGTGVRLWSRCACGDCGGDEALGPEHAERLLAARPAAVALRERHAVTAALDELPQDDPQRALARAGARLAVALPMTHHGRVLGVMGLYASATWHPEGGRLSLLQEIADAVATGLYVAALERARQESEHLVRLQLARAEAMRDRDPLTGVYNRQRFERFVGDEVESSRLEGRPFALIALDLDRFTEINARFGHSAGDQVLRVVALRLQQAVRLAERIGRIGGDSFAVLLPGVDAQDALATGRAVLERVCGSPVEVEGASITVKATAGVVAFPDHGRTRLELLNALDTAILSAREQHVPLAVFDPASHSLRLEAYGRGEEVRRALLEGRVVPALQPVVDLRSGAVWGYEVLARIKGDGEVVEASRFIREAEAYGLLEQLESQMLQHVAELWASGRLGERRLFVNVALDLLGEASYRRLLLETLDRQPGLARQVVLELTERHSLPEGEAVNRFIESVKARGVQLALDDFGAGYSSLGYFRRVPIDYVKIDGSLVRGVARSEMDERVVAAMRRVAQELGAETVAEWIEDEPTAVTLRELGIRFGQGYYLGRPFLAEELLASPDRGDEVGR
ncbi:MAG TPA: GGDEF domain-containing protein [Limnochordales bacterium]